MAAPFNSPPNHLDGCETFVELKTLTSFAMTPKNECQSATSSINLTPRNALMIVPWLYAHKFSGSMRGKVPMADISNWSSANFANLSDDVMALFDLEELVLSKQFTA